MLKGRCREERTGRAFRVVGTARAKPERHGKPACWG